MSGLDAQEKKTYLTEEYTLHTYVSLQATNN